MSKYDIESIRKKLKEKNSKRDPNEFRVQTIENGHDNVRYRFYILPPLDVGDKVIDGVASRSMDSLFYVQNGAHFINNEMLTCPRFANGGKCPVCNLGFSLLKETDPKDKNERQAISKKFLSTARYAVNIYFQNSDVNPANLRGKVMWYNAGMKVYEKLEGCLMAKDSGDDADPRAFGVFYDEDNAYVFQLEAKNGGLNNDYGESKFLSRLRAPLAKTREEIDVILNQRFDLFTKFPAVDLDKLNLAVSQMVDDGDKSDESNNGFSNSTVVSKSEIKSKTVDLPETPVNLSGEVVNTSKPVVVKKKNDMKIEDFVAVNDIVNQINSKS